MINHRQKLIIAAFAAIVLSVVLLVERAASPDEAPAPAESASKTSRNVASGPISDHPVPDRPAPDHAPVPAAGTPSERIAALLSQRLDLSDPERRDEVIAEIRHLEAIQREALVQRAAKFDYPLVTDLGAVLTGFAGETPLYDIPHNAESAVATGADLLQAAPFSVSGTGRSIGQWEVGSIPLLAHSELVGRVTVMDGTLTPGFHASHVAGTLIGAGLDAGARGMAPAASILAHSSTNVISELTALAATAPGQPGMIQISNHAYGAASGWEYDGTAWFGTFSDDGDPATDYVQYFGQYTSETAAWDGLAWNAPYHLIFKSAGNHRDDAAPPSNGVWALNGSSTVFSYDPASHPKSDFEQNTTGFGFGTIDPRASAKNVLTVASVKDVVDAGMNRTASTGTSSLFSSAGPTDDGRIKPDLVTDGEAVKSAGDLFEQHYATSSGTSMAVASAAGSASLLNELYENLLPGQAMHASTLKGLLIHTADDMGRPGPDYEYGWGLMNVKAAADLLSAHAAAGADRGFVVEEQVSNLQDEDEYTFYHDGNGPLRITLSWTDPAGEWTSGHDKRRKRLVHDLDLMVEHADGQISRPYKMPYTSSWSDADLAAVATTGKNRRDNVEQIYLPNAAAGDYTIVVGVNENQVLAQESQDYSLVISGAEIIVHPDPTVANPAANILVPEDDTSDLIGIVDCNQVFSGFGLQFSASVFGGVATFTLNPDGTIDLFRVPGATGTAFVSLMAVDAFGRQAATSFSFTVAPGEVYVSANSPAPPFMQDGYSWETAFSSLQDALQAVVSGQEIWVAEGVYYPDEYHVAGLDTDDRYEYFLVPAGVPLYGGFAGTEEERWERDPRTRLSILSGDIRQDDLQQPIATFTTPQTGTENNSCNVVDLSGVNPGDVFDGFVVTAGNADQSGWDVGAGIWVNRAAPVIANCLVTGNEAADEGAGLWINFILSEEPVKVLNTRFIGNKSGTEGGAVHTSQSGLELFNCEFRGNEAPDGGALWMWQGAVRLVNCVVSGNRGLFGGGGIQIENGTLTFSGCTVTGNYSGGQGGGLHIYRTSVPPVIDNSIFWNNWAGGSTTSATASYYIRDAGDNPVVSNSLVANSGGSGSWNSAFGVDNGGNLDEDPSFVTGVDPITTPTESGVLTLQQLSSAVDAGNSSLLPLDLLDLDADGDTTEVLPIDLAGQLRVAGGAVDMGAYEFGDGANLDSDGDGMSDAFEIAHGGSAGSIDPASDDDGDGLSALAEFVHGQDPNAPLRGPVADYAPMEYLGTNYLCVTFQVNADALNHVDLVLERRGNLTSPLGWQEGQSLQIGSVPSPTDPGMLEVTFRSLVPFGQNGMEFLRLRHVPKP